MNAHDASCRAVPVRIAHVGRPCGAEMSEISQSSRTTTVESSIKSEHNLWYMSMFANNVLLGAGVRVKVWIREQ